MTEKKIIAVMGATGAQGSGLVRAILNDKESEFAVRALTHNVNSDKARELAEMGAEVVFADLDDQQSLEKAFAGAYGAFCVTFFWAHFSPDKEKAGAHAMAEALKKAGVKHAIWSTLEDTRKFIPLDDNRMPTLMEKYKVPHFDAKEESNEFFIQAGVPTTFLYTAFYWENFIYFGAGPQKGPDGNLYLTMPMGDKRLPGISSEDIGKCAYGVFKQGSELIGKKVYIAGEHLSGAQMAASLSKATGKEVFYNDVDPDVYRSFGFQGADEMGNMYQFKRDCNDYYCGIRDLDYARRLNPELKTFDQWLAKNAANIPVS
jgi:uncharacterized protein YbjT (DUF2867 family)